jgi:hypothetical protein
LKISEEENLDIIHDSVAYLKKHLDKVFFDAEHFFDGYVNNPAYALKCLAAAQDAAAASRSVREHPILADGVQASGERRVARPEAVAAAGDAKVAERPPR